jgi:DNA replication protein DnaC
MKPDTMQGQTLETTDATDAAPVADIEEALDALRADVERKRQESAAREAAVAANIAAGNWADVCPADPIECQGLTQDGITPCPAQVCPHTAARDRRMNARYLARCGFGARYRTPDPARLFGGDARAQSVANGLQQWWADLDVHVRDGRGFILSGPPGTGKTFALALTALAAREVTPCAFVSSSMLFNALHEQDVAVSEWRMAPLLLLDDFGVEYAADWAMSRFQEFVEYRHAHCRSTCVTTNLAVADLGKLAGFERIVSRWRETCSGHVWAVGIDDLRGKRMSETGGVVRDEKA